MTGAAADFVAISFVNASVLRFRYDDSLSVSMSFCFRVPVTRSDIVSVLPHHSHLDEPKEEPPLVLLWPLKLATKLFELTELVTLS